MMQWIQLSSRGRQFLSIALISCFFVLFTDPVAAQFTPPTASGSGSCIGFFCNVATRIAGTDVFRPVGPAILNLVMISNAFLAFYLIITAIKAWQKQQRQEDFISELAGAGKFFGFVTLMYLASMAFLGA
jgi:hypothetical protein